MELQALETAFEDGFEEEMGDSTEEPQEINASTAKKQEEAAAASARLIEDLTRELRKEKEAQVWRECGAKGKGGDEGWEGASEER